MASTGFLSMLRTFKRRLMILGTVGLALVILWMVAARLTRSHDSTDLKVERAGSFDVALDDARKVSGFVGSYGRRIDEAEQRLRRKDQELDELRGKLTQQSTELKSLIEAIRNIGPLANRPAEAEATDEGMLPRLQKIQVADSRSGGKHPGVRIPAGSFAEATLLTGVFAPTDGAALPVELRVDDVLVGPNRSRIPIQGAFLVGKAVGDPNSVRAVVQLTKLSFVGPNGKAVEVPINAYVADEDGIQGIAGTYVWRIGEAAASSALSTGLSAAAEAMGSREVTGQSSPLGNSTMLSGDPTRYALSRGAAQATEEVAKIMGRRLEEITPAIHVSNGKRLTVVFLEGVDLPGLAPGEAHQTTPRSPYAGLDLDR